MKARGTGRVFRRVYKDKATGETRLTDTWYIQYSFRGRMYREKTESTRRAHAVKLLNLRLGAIARGRRPGADVERTTFDELAEMLLNDYRANGRRSLNRAEDSVGHLRQVFGLNRALDITADRILAYIADRQRAGAANATINRELAALKRMFRLGQRAGKVTDGPSIETLREDNARKGFVARGQFESVLENLPAYWRPVFETAYITGWRVRSEILTRQKHHVDLASGWLRLEPGETKNGDGRMFSLTPDLREILARRLEESARFERETGQIVPWLFHRNGERLKDYRRAWATACRKAGLPGLIAHDLRRTAVRNLERAGVPRSTAMRFVGHKTESIYRRYAIVDEAMMREGAEKLARLHESEQNSERRIIPMVLPDAK